MKFGNPPVLTDCGNLRRNKHNIFIDHKMYDGMCACVGVCELADEIHRAFQLEIFMGNSPVAGNLGIQHIKLQRKIQMSILFFHSDIFKLNKLMDRFQEILNNIFLPLFEVTNDPTSHPELHKFLQYVSQS